MANLIWKAYEQADKAIMAGVDRGVKAWNWTFGRTKADLANSLLTIAPIVECSSFLVVHSLRSPMASLLWMPLGLGCSHLDQTINIHQENLEAKALESECLDLQAEQLKFRSKRIAPQHLATGIAMQPVAYMPQVGFEATVLYGSAQLVRALSHYVMRTDYLPPKKHCLARARDKLHEYLEAYKRQPATVPVRD